MLYHLLKFPAQFALWIYGRMLSVNHRAFFKLKGPLLIAANHPNSFLDAIILATLFKQPIYSLARGDAFANSFYTKLLQSLKMFPVYRISEGVENLEHNYKTFEQCKEIFKKNGIVLIFSEGRCINEWHLRPLKKGTARLAISAWQDGIPLKVLPTAINYQSFSSFGKNIILNFGELFGEQDIPTDASHGKSILGFNEKLQKQLAAGVYEFEKNDHAGIQKKFNYPVSLIKKCLLFLPAMAGWIFHCIFYIPLQKFAHRKAANNDHYDSVIVGLLFVLYPIYLLLIGSLVWAWLGIGSALGVFIVLPFCAWSFVQIKAQF